MRRNGRKKFLHCFEGFSPGIFFHFVPIDGRESCKAKAEDTYNIGNVLFSTPCGFISHSIRSEEEKGGKAEAKIGTNKRRTL